VGVHHHLRWFKISVVCDHHHYYAAMVTHRPEVTGRKQPARSVRESVGDRLVYTVPEAGRLLGLGRNAAYEAAKRGDIPTLRMGRRLLVPKIPFHGMLGITGTVTATAAQTELPSAREEQEQHD
jgi:excisionase family DNA binding protein